MRRQQLLQRLRGKSQSQFDTSQPRFETKGNPDLMKETVTEESHPQLSHTGTKALWSEVEMCLKRQALPTAAPATASKSERVLY